MPVVQPYYGLPPKEQANFFAEYMNGFLGMRTQQMREEYLRAMSDDPMERMKLQDALIGKMAELDRYRLGFEQAKMEGDYKLADRMYRELASNARTDTETKAMLAAKAMESNTRRMEAASKRQTALEVAATADPEDRAAAQDLADSTAKQLADVLQRAQGVTDPAEIEDLAAERDRILQKGNTEISTLLSGLDRPSSAAGVIDAYRNRLGSQLEAETPGLDNASRGAVIGKAEETLLAGIPQVKMESPSMEEIYQRTPKTGGSAPSAAKGFLQDVSADPFLKDIYTKPGGTTGSKRAISVEGRAPSGQVPTIPEGVEPGGVEVPGPSGETPVYEPPNVGGTIGEMGVEDYAARMVPGEGANTRAMAKTQWEELQGMNKERDFSQPWDINLQKFFGKKDPDLMAKVEAIAKFKKEHPEQYESLMNAYYKANPALARRRSAGIERGQRMADIGLEREYGEGGPPSTAPITGASYGPDLYPTAERAMEAFNRDAEYYGWSPEERERILGSWVDQWPSNVAPKTEEEEREEAMNAGRDPETTGIPEEYVRRSSPWVTSELGTKKFIEPQPLPGRLGSMVRPEPVLEEDVAPWREMAKEYGPDKFGKDPKAAEDAFKKNVAEMEMTPGEAALLRDEVAKLWQEEPEIAFKTTTSDVREEIPPAQAPPEEDILIQPSASKITMEPASPGLTKAQAKEYAELIDRQKAEREKPQKKAEPPKKEEEITWKPGGIEEEVPVASGGKVTYTEEDYAKRTPPGAKSPMSEHQAYTGEQAKLDLEPRKRSGNVESPPREKQDEKQVDALESVSKTPSTKKKKPTEEEVDEGPVVDGSAKTTDTGY